MYIVHDEGMLAETMRRAGEASPEHPVLIDRFLEDAYEVDVDAISDGSHVTIAGIMQHIEEAGIHSGDSACVIPPFHKRVVEHLEELATYTKKLGLALGVRGLMNVQYAIKDGTVYVLEVNPRASRTVPFVAKATGIPLAGLAAKVIVGKTLRELNFTEQPKVSGRFVKESVFPFIRFPEEDPLLGPEMRSTGEVMGVAPEFGIAFAKAQWGAGMRLPKEGQAFLSVNDNDKDNLLPIARQLTELGFTLIATGGTAAHLRRHDIACKEVYKVKEGRPHSVDLLKNGEIDLIINTPFGRDSYFDEGAMRRVATQRGVPLITTLSGGHAAVEAIRALRDDKVRVMSLQEIYASFAGKAR
jgi:carbamoyl-phosphate synthase large subunit